MARFEPNLSASIKRRIGKSALDLDESTNRPSCPDIIEFSDGTYGVIGVDVTDDYQGRLPEGFSIGATERLVAIPRSMMLAAKPDIPDA